MEPESPSPYPQVPATCPYPEPTPSSPHDSLQLTEDTSLYYPPIYVLVSQWPLSLRLPHQHPVHTSILPHTRHMPCPSHSSRFYHPHNIVYPTIMIFILYVIFSDSWFCVSVEKPGVVSDYCVRVRCLFFPASLSCSVSVLLPPSPPAEDVPLIFYLCTGTKVEVLFLQFAFTHPKTFLEKVATVFNNVETSEGWLATSGLFHRHFSFLCLR